MTDKMSLRKGINNRILLTLSLIVAAIPFALVLFYKLGLKEIDFERILSEKKLKMVSSFSVDFEATDIDFYNGNVFFYNLEGGQIIQFDTSGNFIQSIGKKGQELDEFSLIINFSISDNKLYTIDVRNHSLAQFSLVDNKVERFAQVEKNFGRSVYLDDGKFLLMSIDKNTLNNVFEIYDINGKYIKKLMKVYDDHSDGGFATDGFFVKGVAETNYHICFYLSRFFAFNNKGDILFSGNTIENQLSPPRVIEDAEMKFIDPEAKLLSYAGCADSNYLYLVSASKAENENYTTFEENSPIDVYETSSGNYVYSFYIPNYNGKRVRNITKAFNGFFVIQGNNIAYYENFN